jgi:hypothetical protein
VTTAKTTAEFDVGQFLDVPSMWETYFTIGEFRLFGRFAQLSSAAAYMYVYNYPASALLFYSNFVDDVITLA